MSSIFRKDDNYVDKPNRNTFDLSWQNNLSLKFGKLVPCFCQEVIPGDSFKIQPTFGLRFLPQVFPVQTRMRAHMHFFYVRNRTIWKDWMDFIGKTKTGLTVPYLDVTDSETLPDWERVPELHESSIYDYLGLPVTIDYSGNDDDYNLFSSRGYNSPSHISSEAILPIEGNVSYINLSTNQLDDSYNYLVDVGGTKATTVVRYYQYPTPINVNADNDFTTVKPIRLSGKNELGYTPKTLLLCEVSNGVDKRLAYVKYNQPQLQSVQISGILQAVKDYTDELEPITEYYTIYKVLGYIVKVNDDVSDSFVTTVRIPLSLNRNYPLSSVAANTLPYGRGDWQYRINALPFRAYEAIYNSFYRNAENNPFKINGVAEYNKYVHSDDGGLQKFSEFSLFNRNWEDDAFTTAVPTPQQGDAPRVGLTGNPNEPVKLFYSNEDGSVGHLSLNVDSNGRVNMLRDPSGDVANEGLVNALNDAVNFGITINDLRNVNALQLWLEKNVRKGYKYRDQLMSHYGVKISYNDLLMPEFIGGVSRDVTVNQISQTVETSTGNLGDMAGQAYVVGEGNSVTHFCDEHGYIIGILSVVPVPNYSQMIPKHFFKHDTFDYFFPEFGKIGMQPITNKEIAATASWLTHKGDDTFGYQRAWYDYLANVDQVHGKFNSDFYNFLIQRKFGNVPELGADFTTVKNEDLNNIFYTDSDDDKILGQIYFDVKAIRPIPLFGIPSLE